MKQATTSSARDGEPASTAPAIHVRRAVPADIGTMARIRLAVRENALRDPTRVTRQMYEDYLERCGRGWVAEMGGEIVAFSYADKDDASIWALFVDPGHEGLGLARRLLALAVDWLFGLGHASIELSTTAGTRADRFYLQQGWTRGTPRGHEVGFHLDRAAWRPAA